MAGNSEQREAVRQLGRRHVKLASVSAKGASDTKQHLLKQNLSLQFSECDSLGVKNHDSVENNMMFICIGTDLRTEKVWSNSATALYEAIMLLASLS